MASIKNILMKFGRISCASYVPACMRRQLVERAEIIMTWLIAIPLVVLGLGTLSVMRDYRAGKLASPEEHDVLGDPLEEHGHDPLEDENRKKVVLRVV